MYNPLKDRLWLMSGAYLVAGCVVGNLLSSAGAGTAAVWVCVALFVLLGMTGRCKKIQLSIEIETD